MVPSQETPDTNDPTYPTRQPSLRRHRVMIVVLSLAVGWVIYQQIDAKYTANVATNTAHDLGEVVDQQCRTDPSVRREIGSERCGQAADVVRESTIILAPRDGKNGKDGADGRGISSTAVVDGHLFVTYTDGVQDDKGVIAVDGQNGRGISGAALDTDGQLVLTYTDGTSETVGRIVGRNGSDGRGIADVVVSDDYRVIVTYTDGTIDDVGALPPGPSGPTGERGVPGRGVQTVDFNMEECTAKIFYTDGVIETRNMTGCRQPESSPTTTTDNELVIPTG